MKSQQAIALEKLEPQAAIVEAVWLNRVEISQAISLKRIADALERIAGDGKKYGVNDHLSDLTSIVSQRV